MKELKLSSSVKVTVYLTFVFVLASLNTAYCKDLKIPSQYQTITAAIQAAAPNDRVVVTNSGVYKESLIISKSLSLISEPIGAKIVSEKGNGIVVGAASGNVNVHGFVISNCKKNGISIDGGTSRTVNVKMSQVTIENNCESGIVFTSVNPRSVFSAENCLITKNKNNGVVLINQVVAQIDNCTIADNEKDGLEIHCFTPPVANQSFWGEAQLTSTTISGNKCNGIVNYSRNFQLKLGKNCIVKQHQQCGIVSLVPFALEVKNTTVCNNKLSGILVPPVDDPTNTKMEFNLADCSLTSNSNSGLRVDRDVILHATGCDFTGNKEYGIHLEDMASAELDQCSIRKNGQGGLVMQSRVNQGRDTPEGNVQITSTTICENKRGGIINEAYNYKIVIEKGCNLSRNEYSGIYSKTPLVLVARDSRIENNTQNGIDLSQIVPNTSQWKTVKITMDAMCIEGNGHSLLLPNAVNSSMRISNSLLKYFPNVIGNEVPLLFGRINGNNDCEWGWMTKHAAAFFTNCRFRETNSKKIQTYNEISGSFPGKTNGIFLSSFFPSDFLGADGFPVCLPQISASYIDKMVSNFLAVEKVPFTDIEQNFEKYNTPQLLRVIGDAFAAQFGLSDRKQILAKTTEYLRAHPDESISCRLFQGGIGASINYLTKADTENLGRIVAEFPNSAIADTVCTEYSMQCMYWPYTNQSRKTFLDSCKVTSDSLAGIFIAAMNDDKTSEILKTQHIRETYAQIGAKFPNVRKKSQILPPESLADSHQVLALYVQYYDVAKTSIQLADSFRALGREDSANQFYSISRNSASNIYSLTPCGYYIPWQANIGFMFEKSALSSTTLALPVSSIIEMMEKDAQSTARAKQAVGMFLSALDTAKRFPERLEIYAGPSKHVSPKDYIMQYYLEDIATILKNSGKVSLFQTYVDTLRNTIYQSFSPEEIIASVDWLAKAVPESSVKPQNLREQYLQALANCSNKGNNSSKEVEYLECLTKCAETTGTKVQTLNRLASLYEEKWQLPDRAVTALRQILDLPVDIETKIKTNLAIAKILYKEKKFQEVIYEMTQLIAKLPKGYDAAPLRTMLGMAYLGSGNYDDARNELAIVINTDRDKNREQCLYLMGYSYICEQKYAEAVKPFKDLVSLYPNGEYTKKSQEFLAQLDKTTKDSPK